MQKFDIIDAINGQYCTTIAAKNRKSALIKFKNGLLSSGFYWIEKQDGYRYVLLSSYGCEFWVYPHNDIYDL